VERVAINRQGVKNHQFKWYQVRQAAQDPKTWLLFVMAIGAQVPNSALTSVCLAARTHVYLEYTDRETVHFHHRWNLWIRHPRNTVPPNPWWCRSIPYSPSWWLCRN
jgi:hypothetical protein